jgi:O-antigen/teichoic acid export membrane protein
MPLLPRGHLVAMVRRVQPVQSKSSVIQDSSLIARRSSLARRVSRAVLWNAALVPLTGLVALASSIVVVRSLGQERYADYALVLAAITSFTTYGDLGLSYTIPKFVPEFERRGGTAALRSFLGAVLGLKAAIYLLIAVPMLVAPRWVFGVFQLDDQPWPVYAGIAAVTLLEATAPVLHYFLAALFEQKWTNTTRFAVSTLEPLLVIVAALAGGGLAGIVAAMVVARSVRLGMLLWASRRNLRAPASPATSGSESVQPLATSGPALTPQRFVAFSLFAYLDKLSSYFNSPAFVLVVLALYLGDREVALFSLATSFLVRVMNFALSPFTGIIMPLLTTSFASGDRTLPQRSFVLSSKAVALFAVPAATLLVGLAGQALPLLYGPQFAPAAGLVQALTVLLLAEYVLSSGLVSSFLAAERYRDVLTARLVLFGSIPLLYLVIPRAGLLGATLLYGSARFVSVLLFMWLAHRRFGFTVPGRFTTRLLSAAAVSGGVLVVLAAALPRGYPVLAALAVLGVALFAASWKALGGLERTDRELLSQLDIPFKAQMVRLL